MYGNFTQPKRQFEYEQQWGSGAQGNGGHISRADGGGSERKRKKRSRWGAEETLDKTIIPGMPTVIPANLSKEQERQYILHLQIEEISRRLRTGDLGIPLNPEDRSPSPEPIYNNEGKRLNTREYRTRKKLEEERHKLVTEASSLNTEYKPPADYKPPVVRVNDKVMIPQDEHPDINFVGLLIGPRGNTLKTLEKETGAKIIIRGKGSVKDGKIGRKDGQPLPGEDEPLHAYVTANNPENVRKAVDKIKVIIQESVEVPEGQNDLRKQQLRELALLNGTLRENDGLMKLKQLQQAQTIVTNTIICTNCGGTGHLGKDCKQMRPGDTFRNMMSQGITEPGQMNEGRADKAKMDSEYMSLMAELGEGPPPSKQDNMHPHQRGPYNQNQNQHHHHQSRFNNPPPNPMGGFNNNFSGGMNRPPPLMSSNISRPPMNNQLMPLNNQPPRQIYQQQPAPVQQPGMPGRMQQPNQLQPPPLQPLQQPPQQQQFQPLQQQQQNPVPQPVAPPNTITSQFQPNIQQQQPQMTAMSTAGVGVGPVPPPSTQFTSMAAPVPPPQWSNTQAMSSVSQSQPTALGVPPPPSLVAAPPPPPPSQPATTVSAMPWLQGAVPPPPPSTQPTQPAWQTQPPPPPVSMSAMPWSQQQVPQPPGQTVTPSSVVPPPPPPTTGQSYSLPINPSQLLVAPPPPPPN